MFNHVSVALTVTVSEETKLVLLFVVALLHNQGVECYMGCVVYGHFVFVY